MFDRIVSKLLMLWLLLRSSGAILTIIDKNGGKEIYAIGAAPEVDVLACEYAKITIIRNKKETNK